MQLPSKKILDFLLMLLMTFFLNSVSAEFRASDHDGFQRPKEIHLEQDKIHDKDRTDGRDIVQPAAEKKESNGSLYEDLDGFKRPKKDQ